MMKSVPASVIACVVLFAAGCTQSPEKLIERANKYHDNKKYDEASILYQKVLVKDKTNAEAYYRLGLNALAQRKGEDAMQAFRRAVDLNPKNIDAEVKLADLSLVRFVQYERTKGQAGKGTEQSAAEKRALGEIATLDRQILQQQPNSFDGLRIEGVLALANMDTPKALDCFAKANKAKPYAGEFVALYAQTLANTGKPDEAIALINDMLAHDKKWGTGYDFLAKQYLQNKQLDKAELVLREHVDADPASERALMEYADYKLRTGDFAVAEQLMQRTLKDPKAFPNAQMLLGEFYERAASPATLPPAEKARRLDLALAAYKQGMASDSKNAVPYEERLVALQAETKHAPEALAMAKDLVQKNPKNITANYLYARLLGLTNTRATTAKTAEEIKKLVDNNPDKPELRLELAKAYVLAARVETSPGDRLKAANERDKALAQIITDEQKLSSPSLMILAAAQAYTAEVDTARGDRDSTGKALELATLALSELTTAAQQSKAGVLRLDPVAYFDTYARATLAKDRALMQTGQADKALGELEALQQQAPALPEVHALLGDIYTSHKEFDKATAQFETLSKLNDPRGFVGIETVKLYSGRSAEAIQDWQQVVSKNPTNFGARIELANFQVVASNMPPNANQPAGKQLLQQAADNYKEFLKTSASASDVWYRLGRVQQALGQVDPALASYEQAGTADPKNWDAFLAQGSLLELLNRRDEAKVAYNKVLNLQPDNPLVLNNLAMMAADSGSNLDQAQTYAERAKKLAPNSPDVTDTLGYVYLKKNLSKEAAQIFRQNVDAHPEDPRFRFHLAMALFQEGNKQGAKDEASKALQGAKQPDLQNQIKTFVGRIG